MVYENVPLIQVDSSLSYPYLNKLLTGFTYIKLEYFNSRSLVNNQFMPSLYELVMHEPLTVLIKEILNLYSLFIKLPCWSQLLSQPRLWYNTMNHRSVLRTELNVNDGMRRHRKCFGKRLGQERERVCGRIISIDTTYIHTCPHPLCVCS